MTPKEWIEASAQLICLKCGRAIPVNQHGTMRVHGEWQVVEDIASWAKKFHACQVDLDLAREAMKRYRAENPPMTFEEELELYQRLIKP